jgi:hypothetical protein
VFTCRTSTAVTWESKMREAILYPNVTCFNEVDRGGDFAVREEPELCSTEVRAAFRSVR